ncbi:hypothetical protein [Methylobacterium marchantiae]|uniref:Uncharacterized protein n=1 Tax=Methylobacterium marchantiae TaxID=600331 RepID=A0ABW3WT63_9HYPH|nr:hypothetical protein AIGOOFII_2990 [Methylobacterium marchantiae]
MTRPASKPTLDSILENRRHMGITARDLTDGRDAGRADDGVQGFGSQAAWLLGILAGIVMILGTVLAVLALPPVLDCRNRSEQGFFVGQTYGKCVSTELSARWNRLEERVKMMVRRSGQ